MFLPYSKGVYSVVYSQGFTVCLVPALKFYFVAQTSIELAATLLPQLLSARIPDACHLAKLLQFYGGQN